MFCKYSAYDGDGLLPGTMSLDNRNATLLGCCVCIRTCDDIQGHIRMEIRTRIMFSDLSNSLAQYRLFFPLGFCTPSSLIVTYICLSKL